MVKNLPDNNAGDARNMDLIPESRRSPGKGNQQPSLVFLSGKFHGQRNLVCYGPWDCKESDITEHAYTHTPTHTHINTERTRTSYINKY